MAATIATNFSIELADWNKSIDYCNEEITELTERLAEVIRRNSITGIAEKVEVQQAELDKVSALLSKLQWQISAQEAVLKTDSTLADDKLIEETTVHNQDLLRRSMQAVEKDWIDVKYNCYHFLSHLPKK